MNPLSRRRLLGRLALLPALYAPWMAGPRAATLGASTAADGVRAALARGAELAVERLGQTDGFLGNAAVRIGLPRNLAKAEKLLRRMGQGEQVDALVTAMNRAAEAAVPAGKQVLVDTVKSLSVDDALKIVRGGDTAVTDWFSGRTRKPLGEAFAPIVQRTTGEVALAQHYDAVAGRAAKLGLMKTEDADLAGYVTSRTLDGLYKLVGEEERKIRQDPVATGSALLKQVFGR
ncbi:DUF4197 domain-containing protein [Pseudaquabacterium rugosum]|uniref:DUF4197 domain-containing protein n=1 Tax=Pseudaquabacterium rugosum TaxID=2984194 RepID=A0ABU9BAM6_9BURK